MSFLKNFTEHLRVKEKELQKREEMGEELFHKAIQFNRFGNQTEAIRLFSESIEVSPYHAAVYLNRGACLMIQERYLEAFNDFKMAIDLEASGQSVDEENTAPHALANINRLEPMLNFESEHGELVRTQMNDDGIEHFTKRYAEVLLGSYLENNVAQTMQFVFEELKELSEMGGVHQDFAFNCGIDHSLFSNISTEFDTREAFLFFKSILCCLSDDYNLMFEARKNILINLIQLCSEEKESSYSDRLFDLRLDNDFQSEMYYIVGECRRISQSLVYESNESDIEELQLYVKKAFDIAVPIYESLSKKDLGEINALVIIVAFYLMDLANVSIKTPEDFEDCEIENASDYFLSVSGVPSGTVDSSKFTNVVRLVIEWLELH